MKKPSWFLNRPRLNVVSLLLRKNQKSKEVGACLHLPFASRLNETSFLVLKSHNTDPAHGPPVSENYTTRPSSNR